MMFFIQLLCYGCCGGAASTASFCEFVAALFAAKVFFKKVKKCFFSPQDTPRCPSLHRALHPDDVNQTEYNGQYLVGPGKVRLALFSP